MPDHEARKAILKALRNTPPDEPLRTVEAPLPEECRADDDLSNPPGESR